MASQVSQAEQFLARAQRAERLACRGPARERELYLEIAWGWRYLAERATRRAELDEFRSFTPL